MFYSKELQRTFSRVARNWLSPYLLLILRDWNTYGYEMVQRLGKMGFSIIDQGTIYRNLRQLENNGLVISQWSYQEGEQPRRLYTITDTGRLFLEQWAGMMEQYQSMLESFFMIYRDDKKGDENNV